MATTPVGILWTLLSIIVSGVCGFSFLQPFWLLHRDTMNSLGMFSMCVRDNRLQKTCGVYGGREETDDGGGGQFYFSQFHFSNMPSNAWQAACVLYGGGCAFLCLAALLAVSTLCLPSVADKRLAVFTGYIQTMASKYFLS